jgi:3-phosphoshikimate 1-carboxyvinyltransferase
VIFRMGEDWLEVDGCAGPPPGLDKGAAIVTHMDHRIAMSFLGLGRGARRAGAGDDGDFIDTSVAGVGDLVGARGADIRAAGEVRMAPGGERA